MSGTSLIIRVLPITTFNMTPEGIGGPSRVLVRNVIGTVFTEAEFLIRLHTGTLLAAGNTVQFFAHSDGYDDQDGTTNFDQAAGSTGMISAPASSPALYVLGVTAGFGERVSLTMTSNQSTAGSTFIVVVSVDLVLKGGDASLARYEPNSALGYRFQ